MKKYKDLFNEGLLDDLLGDFNNDEPESTIPKATRVTKSRRKFRPRITKAERPTGFFEYIYSEKELKDTIKQDLGLSYSLPATIELFAQENKGVTDSVILDFSVDELDMIREYSRVIRDGWTGKSSAADMKILKADIKNNGIQNHGVIDMRRMRNGDVATLLGEGNHRLTIAKELGIKTMPVKIYYQTSN